MQPHFESCGSLFLHFPQQVRTTRPDVLCTLIQYDRSMTYRVWYRRRRIFTEFASKVKRKGKQIMNLNFFQGKTAKKMNDSKSEFPLQEK